MTKNYCGAAARAAMLLGVSHAFGAVAEAYHRWRTAIPYAAFDWMVPQPCRRVVELGAGTGIQTRRLTVFADEVLAVEPDPKMRAVCQVDGAKLLVGTAEDIPVEDGGADLVVALDSWHWFAQPEATNEAARVLRPGGTLAVAWNLPELADDWTVEFWRSVTAAHDETRRPGRLMLGVDAPFATPQYRVMRWTSRRSADDFVALLGTYSQVIAMDPLERGEFLDRQRELLPIDPDGMVDARFTTVCWRIVHMGA
ncbi:class I SAM-dependent methyltransferase [Kutzneria sp. CA-103260]|uniref:class I SAM-dependent methyltransferase n=1 Tax=Kutzneria sp. CA-103260 TaxID=2802641 RepID=UPI001BAC4EB6|nr:class I SAM-dependent methyltransferase [Kutzneria sp. CA-103260]QUQ62620.1 methyltransferase type 11 [Kutzneria sp. CA-103260]